MQDSVTVEEHKSIENPGNSALFQKFDALCESYLKQWDHHSTIRWKKRFTLDKSHLASEIFPRQLQRLLFLPEVQQLGEEKIHTLLVRSSYKWMGDIAALEAKVVSRLCSDLANNKYQFSLTQNMRKVALTIGTDEMYHAFIAREYIDQLAELTGITPLVEQEDDYPLIRIVAYLKDTVPAEHLPESEMIALCFAENFVTEELFGLVKGTEPSGCFHQIIREHMVDEGRHRVFFSHLLAHIWRSLSEETKTLWAKLLPTFLNRFLLDESSVADSYRENLLAIGCDDSDINRWLGQVMPNNYDAMPDKSVFPHVQATLALVAESGMLDHAELKNNLSHSGWIKH